VGARKPQGHPGLLTGCRAHMMAFVPRSFHLSNVKWLERLRKYAVQPSHPANLCCLQMMQSAPKSKWKFMQKYWHKGAYYQTGAPWSGCCRP
jgi:Microfibril-associated/Pre-mRNA processing